MANAVIDYLKAVDAELRRGCATEHSYRPALKDLIESLGTGLAAVNEPKRSECGAPDFLVSKRKLPLGYIEAKDVGVDLNAVERSAQMKRYLPALENLILTNYLEFRWYVNGEIRQVAQAGRQLSYDDLAHYQRIVVALQETGRIMGEIDGVIGKWPVG